MLKSKSVCGEPPSSHWPAAIGVVDANGSRMFTVTCVALSTEAITPRPAPDKMIRLASAARKIEAEAMNGTAEPVVAPGVSVAANVIGFSATAGGKKLMTDNCQLVSARRASLRGW